MEENTGNLDTEFKRYLQILRPYLGQLMEKDAIQICNEWIQRLSSCREEEKPMRNKYSFLLCYQLSKGILDEPFLKGPPFGELPSVADITISDTSSELDYVVNENNDDTKLLLDRTLHLEKSLYSLCNDGESNHSDRSSRLINIIFPKGKTDNTSSGANRKPNIVCYTYPDTVRSGTAEIKEVDDVYESRANNLIMRLRDIKRQNILLRSELEALKEESQKSSGGLSKVDNYTCTYENIESTTVGNLKSKIKALKEEREYLKTAMESMQIRLDEFEDKKKYEFEELEAKHKLEVSKLKSSLREENKLLYEEKIDELKLYYESIIADMQRNESKCTERAKYESKSQLETLLQEKSKEIEEKELEINTKNKELLETNNTIQSQNLEITHLKKHLDEQSKNLHSVLNNLFAKQTENINSESVAVRTQELEKRLNKMEKSKAKCLKFFEEKLAGLQREKHLAECSLQFQLVKQRAQIVNELADENQAELATALDKLESKYKDIVANVQSTAIQRRAQDEAAINAILEAACACGLRNEIFTKHSTKAVPARYSNEGHLHGDSEISGILHPKTGHNHSLVEASVAGGFCLDSERLGELFDQVCIPMRDNDPTKK